MEQLGFFKAEEVFWNRGYSINILSAAHIRKAPQGKILELSLVILLDQNF